MHVCLRFYHSPCRMKLVQHELSRSALMLALAASEFDSIPTGIRPEIGSYSNPQDILDRSDYQHWSWRCLKIGEDSGLALSSFMMVAASCGEVD